MIKTPDYLVPIELAERLKEIGFDKEVHFFFLYYEGHKMLRKRGSKFGFITSDGCNPANVDNYNRIKDRTSIPTWFEVIEWFEGKIEKLNIIIQEVDTSGYLKGVEDFFICKFLTEEGKYKIDSNTCFYSMIRGISIFKHIKADENTLKVYSDKRSILIASINYLIDYYKSIKQ